MAASISTIRGKRIYVPDKLFNIVVAMRSFVALGAMFAVILTGCSSGDKNSTSSTTSPTAIAAAPASRVTPCVPDVMDSAPCPGTPEPVMHQPLPPPGPISDSDLAKHVPASLSEHDRKIVEWVMRAQPDYERPYVRWIYCKSKIFVFSIAGAQGLFTATQVLNDDPRPKSQGGDSINIHNCLDFGMPGG